MRDRYHSVAQAFALYRAIQTQARTRAELAAQLKTSEDTIRRLLAALESAEIPIRSTRRPAPLNNGPLEFRAGSI